MNKVFTTAIVSLALGIGLIGCGLLDPETDNDSVTVKISPIPAITSASNQPVGGEISASVIITSVTYTIKDSAGEAVNTITVSKNNTPVSEKKLNLTTDLAVVLQVTALACNGSYTLEIEATAGTATSKDVQTFTVSGVKDCSAAAEDTLTAKQVTVGNQSAASGSALDVDLMTVHSSSAATASAAIQGQVDVVFGIVASAATMMAPGAVAGFAPDSWTVKNPTKILKVSANFEQTKTQSAIDALWSAASATTTTAIAAGDVFVIQTAAGTNHLLSIVSASVLPSGEAIVNGKIK